MLKFTYTRVNMKDPNWACRVLGRLFFRATIKSDPATLPDLWWDPDAGWIATCPADR